MESMSSCLIVAHGGEWKNNIYDGGRKEYIPVPPSGITFDNLLNKLEMRLKKDKCKYIFDIDALVQSPIGETMRMKITDDFEWCSSLRLMELPTIYVSVSPRNLQNETENIDLLSTWNLQKEIVNIDDDDSDSDSNCDYEITFDSIADDEWAHSHDYVVVDSGIVPPLDSSSKTTSANEGEPRQWLIPGASYQASLGCEDFEIRPEPVTGELVCGATFSSKNEMTTALGVYHMKNHAEFGTDRSNSLRYHVICKFPERCDFIMRARSFGASWRIYEWRDHTCVTNLRYQSHPRVSSKVLAAHVGPTLSEEGYIPRPRDIQGQFLREFGVNVKYSTALAGRNHAMSQKYGDPDGSFQLVPKYLYMLQQLNPDSIVDLKTCDDGSFQYCYFSLGASIRGFRACRPVIVIDATHLKGKYKGVMFVASTKDANEQILPLAFGVGDKENDSSWTWFVGQLRRTFGCPDNLLFVSDQHHSIRNAVKDAYPGIPHGLCTYHIQGNLKNFGQGVIELFKAAANAYKVEDFEVHMHNLELAAPQAHAKLMSMDPIRWALCKCPVRRYAFGTSNAVEVMNSRLKWARKLPICSLLEYARNLVQEWFFRRRSKAGARTHELSEYAMMRLKNACAGLSMKVEPITDTKFKVISGNNSNFVDIGVRMCSCHVFDMDLIPCSHATAAITHKRQSTSSYVHSYYTTQIWREIYAAEVMPVPDPIEWRIPSHVTAMVVGTPSNPRQAGRPPSRRFKSGAHTRSGRACSRCHEKGHYENTCTTYLQISIEEEVCSSQASVKRTRKQKKCGICGVGGHTRKTCKETLQ